MTLYKIFKENEEKISDDMSFSELAEESKQSQLALIDGVIKMLEEEGKRLWNESRKMLDEDNVMLGYDMDSRSIALRHFKDKLLAERKLIEENK